jgi:magnesium chelatase subunit I
LLDRFGLSVEVTTPQDIASRIDIVRRRDAYDRDPKGFSEKWAAEDRRLLERLEAARALLPAVEAPDSVLEMATRLCMALGTDGLRAELTLLRAARALASLEGETTVSEVHVRRIAPSSLRHRLRRDPLDESGSTARVTRAIGEVFAA